MINVLVKCILYIISRITANIPWLQKTCSRGSSAIRKKFLTEPKIFGKLLLDNLWPGFQLFFDKV